MKTLILTRHAKSSWNSEASTDFERPLNKRGMRDAPEMAKRLARRGPMPDSIVSSTATRALVTTRLMMSELSLHSRHLTTTDSIYEAPVKALLDAIGNLPNQCEVAMLVGHNPGMSNTGNYLCTKAALQMPTCAMACLELDVDKWTDVYRDCAVLRWYDYPKNQIQNGAQTFI